MASKLAELRESAGNRLYEEVIEDGTEQHKTVHRIRANSTIMQHKKLLGESTNASRSLSEV